LLSLFVLSSCVTAQPGDATDTGLKKRDQKTLAAARSDLDLGKFLSAREQFTELLQRYPDQSALYYLRSVTNKEMGDYSAALADVESGLKYDPNGGGPVLKELGALYAASGRFTEAAAAYERYAASTYVTAKPRRQEQARMLTEKARAAAALAARPVAFAPEPVAGGINSPDNLEYFPSLSVDGQRMIFTRRVGGQQEDFYLSERLADGGWSAAQPLEGINTDFNEGAQTISADGRYLVFTACDRPDGAGSCDLYFSELREDGVWSVARNMGPEINSREYDAQPSLSADGSILFFASRRPGGAGAEDLYVAGRYPDGKWSKPVNLGATINTKGREQYPFFSPDGSTLFFTSNTHPGLGGDDLFRSTLSADNEWGEPQNLGYPINTADDETNLFVALGGSTAYFSKGKRDPATGKMDVDIYQFELPKELRPAFATYVEVTVTDAETGKPLAANVRLRPIDQSGAPVSRRTGESGTFLAVLPEGKDYALTVDLPGYLFFAERFSLTEGFTQADPYELTVALSPVREEVVVHSDREEADGAIAFRNVLFTSGSAELLPVSGDELDRLAELLQKAPTFRVEIVGHTDNVGKNADNLELSRERAASVKSYLENQGISADRIITRGDGESRPVATNDTEAGRAANRRTTFKLIPGS